MLVSDSGSEISESEVQFWNAPSPILTTLSGTVIFARLLLLLKAYLPMAVTPSGTVISVALPL